MKTQLSLIAIGGALLFSGCYAGPRRARGPSPTMHASYSYVYYPDAEVYYQPQRHIYFWAEGGTWRSGPRVPATFVLSSRVTVNLNSPEPYQRHNEVRAQHPGSSHRDRLEHNKGHDKR